MRIFAVFVVGLMLGGVIGFAAFALVSRSSIDSASPVAATTISPHEIHVNYSTMNSLPIHKIDEPF